jgi:hypothetical protein
MALALAQRKPPQGRFDDALGGKIISKVERGYPARVLITWNETPTM